MVLVDFPLPRWHKERPSYEGYYRQGKTEFVKRPGICFCRHSDMDKDEDFYYEVHPKPHVTIEWAKRLAAALSTLPSSGASVAG